MTYGPLHRFLLRTVASRGVLLLTEAEEIVNKFSEDECHMPVKDLVKQINDEIRPYQQSVKVTSNELTDEEVIVFLSLGHDDATKSQNLFSATELEYFKIILEEIMSTETRQITGIHSINLVSKMKASFTKTDAQRLLNTWCRMHYLEKDGNNYALGVRTIHEFESYLRQNMPDTIEECCLCKQIVFRGCNCPSCSLAVHTRCLNRYLEKVEKWPCCKTDFSASQLEQLNSESSRIIQTQHPDMTRQQSEVFDTMADATQDCSDELDPSQDIIPEISQRVTRKRKRT